MNTLDENVWDSLDQVLLHVDALLQCTTTSPAADVQATPPSALALAPQPAPTSTLAPTPDWTLDPIPAPDPAPATDSAPAPTPALALLPPWAHVWTLAPHPCHSLFPHVHGYVDNCAAADTLQPRQNLYQGTPL
jgi:hypothetical protein